MVVVEVRQGAGGEETRRGEEKRGEEEEEKEDEKREEKEEDEDEEEATDIKSNNPHLAGGEKSETAFYIIGAIDSLCSTSPSGWWYTYPSEKYEFVSWDHYSQYMESHKSHVPNHRPAIYSGFTH